MINAFSIAAILSSFIGVGLGVFDYLADFFKFDNCKLDEQVMGCDFPTSTNYVNFISIGFLKSYWVCWCGSYDLTSIIPALLAYKSRKINTAATFRVCVVEMV